MELNHIYTGDAMEVLKSLPSESVNCVVTSPPYYGLRDYGVYGQIGLENSPDEYIGRLVDVFRQVYRVLKHDDWYPLGVGICVTFRGLVFATRYYMA